MNDDIKLSWPLLIRKTDFEALPICFNVQIPPDCVITDNGLPERGISMHTDTGNAYCLKCGFGVEIIFLKSLVHDGEKICIPCTNCTCQTGYEYDLTLLKQTRPHRIIKYKIGYTEIFNSLWLIIEQF